MQPRILAALVVVLCLAPAITAQAVIRTVPLQYETIQLALDDSREGDIILVSPGTYHEALTIPRSVYLISEEPLQAVIDADHGDAIRADHVEMLQVIGFTIRNCRAAVLATETPGAVVDSKVEDCVPQLALEDVISFNGTGDATIYGVEIADHEAVGENVGVVGMYVAGAALVQDVSVTNSDTDGFKVRGSSAALLDCSIDGATGDAVEASADHLLVARNTIEYATGTGLAVVDGSEVTVIENTISHCEFGVEFHPFGGDIGQALLLDNEILSSEQAGVVALSDVGDLYVGRCTIADGGSRGIWLQDPDMTAVVHDNEILNNGVLGISVGLAAEGFLEQSDVTIRRNVIAGNVSNGIQIQDSDALVANNTLYANGDFGIYHETSSDTPTFWPTLVNNVVTDHAITGISTDYDQCDLTYTLAWNNTVDLDLCTGGDGIVSEDPLFTDAASGDFSLGLGSPAIDTGDPDTAWDDEDGSRNDMGATGGPAEPAWPDDEPPTLEFPPEADLQEGSARTISLPEDVDPEGYPVLVQWEISGGSNGDWTAYGTTIALNGEDDGTYTWTTTITDPFGQTAQAQGSLTVTNVSPGLTSTMPETATVGVPYLYQAEYFDPGFFDEHTFTLPTAPEGMTVDDFGVVEWTPADDQAGDHQVELVVTDDDGDSTSQIRIITVRGGATGTEDDCSCRLDRGRTPGGAALAALLLIAGIAARRTTRRRGR